ncbi:DNA topoisomerase III [Pseudostreptobacillus hongkongensis]|uniref:DNA topoisomerase III n=1 Tax=Pseudostreptobacillus hongkongensis TaxID=1162717 RepID=UPI0009ECAD01|nr:DNA topoisomerase III [Pseudostreptobacillus hongkongensis]
MKLIIAEKPELARAIAEAIPGTKNKKDGYIEVEEYCVTWAAGHLLKLYDPQDYDEKYKKWDLSDLPINFENWKKKIIDGKGKLVNNIKKLIKDADEVINAGDPDDEGQLLIDEIIQYLNYKGKVSRILINDNNTESIKKAFTKIESNEKYKSLGVAAEARSIADLLVGINLTRFFTLYNNTGNVLSIGRVQTPTLAMVVNRDNEIKNHIKEKYYELFLNTNVENNDINLKYKQDKDIEKVLDKSILENIIIKLDNKNGKLEISKKVVEESTPLPFNLANLQIEANKKYGYSAQKTQDITQSLREKHKAITYNRSDCEYLSEEHFKEAPKLLPIVIKNLEVNIKVNYSEENKSRAFNDKNITAHHGIIPTLNGDISSFNKEEKNIYELIAKRYVIQFMTKKKVEKTEGILNVEDNIFKATSSKILDKGYSVIYSEDKEENDEMTGLSNIKEGIYNIETKKEDYKIEERESQPKKAYTEATLLKDMTSISKYVKDPKIKEILLKKDKDKKGESGSIGTPATRASIIEGLFKKGYLEYQGKNIKSTALAIEYLKTLPEELKAADMTALWYVIQEDIKDGKVGKEALIKYVLDDINRIISMDHKKIDNSFSTNKNPKDLKEGEVLEIKSEKGTYYKGYFEGKVRNIPSEYKYFDNILKITKSKAEKLFKGNFVEFDLKYKEKEYKQKMKLVINGDYLNLAKAY